MQFNRVGDYEVITRITGPHHHFLGLRLAPGGGASLAWSTNVLASEMHCRAPLVEAVSLSGEVRRTEVRDDFKRIVDEVTQGLCAANAHLGTDYEVAAVRYCDADPPVPGIYADLAEQLVEHLARADHEVGTQTV
jgi:hypothetical protein